MSLLNMNEDQRRAYEHLYGAFFKVIEIYKNEVYDPDDLRKRQDCLLWAVSSFVIEMDQPSLDDIEGEDIQNL